MAFLIITKDCNRIIYADDFYDAVRAAKEQSEGLIGVILIDPME